MASSVRAPFFPMLTSVFVTTKWNQHNATSPCFLLTTFLVPVSAPPFELRFLSRRSHAAERTICAGLRVFPNEPGSALAVVTVGIDAVPQPVDVIVQVLHS